jgi:succinoglycan biosynthesis protein ExoA
MASPAASIVIPCRNEVKHIAACLESVLAFDDIGGGFEVIVADGMSTDGTREIIARITERDKRVRLIDNPKRQTSAALNAGIRAACGDIIVRIDAHTEYAPDYLRQCLAVSDATQADNVGGPALTKADTILRRAICAAYHSRFAVGNASFHQADYEGYTDTVPYGCWRKVKLLEIGLFDEELIRNQDDELNLRLTRAGGKIYQSPRIRSWYAPRASLMQLFRQYWQYGYWKVRVIQKHRIPASVRHLVPGAFAATLILLLLLSPFVIIARGLLMALIGIYAGAVLGASLITAWHSEWKFLPVLPAVFACYHLGYGLGFLMGIIDFVVLKRRGRFAALTR